MGQPGKIQGSNSFEGGLVADLHLMSSPSNTVIDALNMELVTVGDSQYIYQNVRGNKKVVDMPYADKDKGYQYVPLGVKTHNNIGYIVVGAFDNGGNFISGGIGSFPSPDWEALNSGGTSKLKEEFAFLHNFSEYANEPATSPFVSNQFEFIKNKFIDISIQGDFDGSVNIIFTDNKNSPAIINSRFKRVEGGNTITLADRNGMNDGNTYSDEDWDRIALIQNANFPVTVESTEIMEGGYLKGGGYRYYFKYATQEGNTTEILYESPLIPISNNGLGISKSQESDRLIRFTLKDLDTSYTGIKVYFAHINGSSDEDMEVFTIANTFTYKDTTDLVITHTGLEEVSAVDVTEINTSFTPIDTIKTATIINDRLAMAGASSTLSENDVEVLANAAKSITLFEKTITISKSYADPETAATKLGYWKGEVYEFAVVYMLKNKGLSPAFPVTGMDNLEGIQGADFTYPDTFNIGEDGFDTENLYNHKGLFRTSNAGSIYKPTETGGLRNVTYISADTSKLSADVNPDVNKLATGFFLTRRKRVKNVLFQGMAVPTLKLPSKYPTIAEQVTKLQTTMDASKRYLIKHFNNIEDKPTLGLNAPYMAMTKSGESIFNADFDVVFVPQPTQIINALTFEKSWAISGSIGQAIDSTLYGKTLDHDGEETDKVHIGIIACEIDLNYNSLKDALNGIDPGIRVQKMKNGESPIGYTSGGFAYRDDSNLIIRGAEEVSVDRAGIDGWVNIPAGKIKATLLDSGKAVYANNAFTAKTDRALGFLSTNESSSDDEDVDTSEDAVSSITFGAPFANFVDRITLDKNILNSNARHAIYRTGYDYYTGEYDNITSSSVGFDTDASFRPYSIISQSYSKYLGIEINVKDMADFPTFNYIRQASRTLEDFANGVDAKLDSSIDNSNRLYTNLGHLVNVYRSSGCIWDADNVIDIYKHDSNKAYHAVTDRFTMGKESVNIYRGDCFISKIYKKLTYKNGVSTAKSATSADAGSYGIGLVEREGRKVKPAEDLPEEQRKDQGRGLFDVGQVIEIVTQSNINGDIRSTETLSDDDTAIYGSDRDFYPNKEEIFGDARPDSVNYNHGYSGDLNPISYSRIEEDAPTFNTEFPNRILLSEKNKTQSFFNSFRNIKGFNYRDYGIELGPVVKLIGVKNVLLSVHSNGVLAIGIDDKTLVSEGSSVYVNTAEALSPVSETISNQYGSVHPESIVGTETTVAGVDYNESAVWLFEGNKLSIISEFAIKTVLDDFKEAIEDASFDGAVDGRFYNPRVYSTFNNTKHTLFVSYVAEDTETSEQIHIGSVTYNTVLQKWVSRLSEGNKLMLSVGSNEYSVGFNAENGDIHTIWKEDALKDVSGNMVRGRLRGIDYTHEFEFVINTEPAAEKLLENLIILSNKSIPDQLVFTTTGEENDAAGDIWGEVTEERVLTQNIVTRNKSKRKNLRLGILDENAYYKNSKLYIQAGKFNAITRKEAKNKRIRDKGIKVRVIYSGNDETFIQGIITLLSISHS